MFIQRDISPLLLDCASPVQLVIGPRQCGKSTLLSYIAGPDLTEVTFDDLRMRELANKDPMLFLEQFITPLLLDESQYAPNIFPEIKKRVDQLKRNRLTTGEPLKTLYWMTGSNQILMEENVRESLAGRASYLYLNTLTVHEIIQSRSQIAINEILYKGGWPELYIDPDVSVTRYLNDYIRSYIEKDIVLSAGILKQDAFNQVLCLLAARTGMLLDYSNVAKDSGVKSVTIKEWVGLLQRASLVHCLKPYSSNLNKRLIKSPKFYFLDTGLCARLQGWSDPTPLMTSSQVGALFETLVFAEIFKYIQNYQKDWQVYYWRTKEGEEVDFIIRTPQGSTLALDAKLSMQGAQPMDIPNGFKKVFPNIDDMTLVTYGGEAMQLSPHCRSVPIAKLHDFLAEHLD